MQRYKIIISFLLIIISVYILFQKQNKSLTINEFEILDYFNSINIFDILYDQDRNKDMSKILPLFIINTDICSQCINNIDEYADLFKFYDEYFDPILIFINEEERDVNRFINLTNLKISHHIIYDNSIKNIPNKYQEIIFFNSKGKKIINNMYIPNYIVSLTDKELQVENIITNPYPKNNQITK